MASLKKKNIKIKGAKKSDALKKLKGELKKQVLLYNELMNKQLRLLAEFENYKKRSERRISDAHNFTIEKLILSFLPFVDDIDRTIQNNKTEAKNAIIDGIKLIFSNIKKVLNKYDVESYESIGNEFDVDYHEAVMSKESDKSENIIIEEFEKGYKLKDRIIRHAKVIVSKGKK